MTRSLGKLQRKIIRLTDELALSNTTDLTSAENYLNTNELSLQLGVSVENVIRALKPLVGKGIVRQFPIPDPKKRNRKYGSILLPIVTWEDIADIVQLTRRASVSSGENL